MLSLNELKSDFSLDSFPNLEESKKVESSILPNHYLDREWTVYNCAKVLNKERDVSAKTKAGVKKLIQGIQTCTNSELVDHHFLNVFECLVTLEPLSFNHPHLTTLFLNVGPGGPAGATLQWALGHGFDNFTYAAVTRYPYFEEKPPSMYFSNDIFFKSSPEYFVLFRDGTGDLTKRDNRLQLQKMFESEGKLSDLTICSGTFELDFEKRSETKDFCLKASEILAALDNTSNGGTVIVRFSNLAHFHCMGLIYLLCELFERANLLKPFATCLYTYEVYGIFQDFNRQKLQNQEMKEKLKILNTTDDDQSQKDYYCKTIPATFTERYVEFANKIYKQVNQCVYIEMGKVWEGFYLHHFCVVQEENRKLTKCSLYEENEYKRFTSWYCLNRPLMYDENLSPLEDMDCVYTVRISSIETSQMNGNKIIIKSVCKFLDWFPEMTTLLERTYHPPTYICSSRFNCGYVILNRFKLHRVLLHTLSEDQKIEFFNCAFNASSERYSNICSRECLEMKTNILKDAMNKFLKMEGLLKKEDITWLCMAKSPIQYLDEDYSDWKSIMDAMTTVLKCIEETEPGKSIFLCKLNTTSVYSIGFVLLLRLLFHNVMYVMIFPDVIGIFLYSKLDNNDELMDKVVRMIKHYIDQKDDDDDSMISPPPVSPLLIIDVFDKSKMLRDVLKYNSVVWSITNFCTSNCMLHATKEQNDADDNNEK